MLAIRNFYFIFGGVIVAFFCAWPTSDFCVGTDVNIYQFNWTTWSNWSECKCLQSSILTDCDGNATRWRKMQRCFQNGVEHFNCTYQPYQVEFCSKICDVNMSSCTWTDDWESWSSCNFTHDADCGYGFQHQRKNVCNCSGQIYHSSYCGLSPVRVQSCFVPCPETCMGDTISENLTMNVPRNFSRPVFMEIVQSPNPQCGSIDSYLRGFATTKNIANNKTYFYGDSIIAKQSLGYHIPFKYCNGSQFGKTSAWSNCTSMYNSSVCGNGTRFRESECLDAKGNITHKKYCYGVSLEMEPCRIPCYAWTEWGNWSICVTNCTNKTKTRFCTEDGIIISNTSKCVGDDKVTEPCYDENRPCYDWSVWSDWGEFKRKKKTRTRTCRKNYNVTVDNLSFCGISNESIDIIYLTKWEELENCTDCKNVTKARKCIRNDTDISSDAHLCNVTLQEESPCKKCSDIVTTSGTSSTTTPTFTTQVTTPVTTPVTTEFTLYHLIKQCKGTCGTGTRKVFYECKKGGQLVSLSYCGKENEMEIEECQLKPCSIYTLSITRSNCTGECGIGRRNVTMKCHENSTDAAVSLTICNITTYNTTELCQLDKCSEEIKWGDWETNGECSTSCGGGKLLTQRICLTGDNCVGDSRKYMDCNTEIKCPVHGNVSEWTDWTICSKTCGKGGISKRVRECSNPPPSFGGKFCEEELNETVSCNEHIHCPGPYLAKLNETCDLSCKPKNLVCLPYEKVTISDVKKEFAKAGVTCKKFNDSKKIDNGHGWDVVFNKKAGNECILRSIPVNQNVCLNTTVDGERLCNCQSLDDLVYSEWAIWGSCTKSCGYGKQTRYRECINAAKCEMNKDKEQLRSCNEFGCEIDGNWGQWSEWRVCSATCGGGKRDRVRYCTDPSPMHGGRNCTGPPIDIKTCGETICPIHGGYGNWSEWSNCEPICGNSTGYRKKHRHCNNPKPSLGGENCKGPFEQKVECPIKKCADVKVDAVVALCAKKFQTDEIYVTSDSAVYTDRESQYFKDLEKELQEKINSMYPNLPDNQKPRLVLHNVKKAEGKYKDICKDAVEQGP